MLAYSNSFAEGSWNLNIFYRGIKTRIKCQTSITGPKCQYISNIWQLIWNEEIGCRPYLTAIYNQSLWADTHLGTELSQNTFLIVIIKCYTHLWKMLLKYITPPNPLLMGRATGAWKPELIMIYTMKLFLSSQFPLSPSLNANLYKRREINVLNLNQMRSTIFCDVTPCNLVEVCLCSGGTYCLHLQGQRTSKASRKSYCLLLAGWWPGILFDP